MSTVNPVDLIWWLQNYPTTQNFFSSQPKDLIDSFNEFYKRNLNELSQNNDFCRESGIADLIVEERKSYIVENFSLCDIVEQLSEFNK